jgi:hypothetical protein
MARKKFLAIKNGTLVENLVEMSVSLTADSWVASTVLMMVGLKASSSVATSAALSDID